MRLLPNTKRIIGVYKMSSLSAGSAIRDKSSTFHFVCTGWGPWKVPAVRRRTAVALAIELFLAAASYTLTLLVMLGPSRTVGQSLSILRDTLPFVFSFRLAALLCTGIYRRSLRYASTIDLLPVAKTVLAGSAPLAIFLSWRFSLFAPSFFLVDAAFLQILWCSLPFAANAVRHTRAASSTDNIRRTLVVGAGNAGVVLLRAMALDPESPVKPVGILDDDASKWGRTICGVPVRGGVADLAVIASELKAEEVLVCIPSATRTQMQSILGVCRRASMPVRTLPPIAELLQHGPSAGNRQAATVSPRDLRQPQIIEDLLQRAEIDIDQHEAARLVAGEVVLVTGAGGSIGAELCRQVAAAGPQKLLLLDKSENGLFYANLEAAEKLGSARVQPILADLLDQKTIRRFLATERPSIVFHAAAYKHVALMELHPREVIRNNVVGTRNIAEAAVEYGVKRFVNISTDKAVNPTNWMGLSKKVTELCMQEMSTSGITLFSNVRFGNVAGSSGSVLRLFWERIENGKPIKVTDPQATRFFMSVPEAVHLILRAAALGGGGETFIFDMGEPLNICDLAKTMMLYSGLRPGRDLEIEFVGLNPGEKVTEELWEAHEKPVASGSSHILVIRGRDPRALGILKKIEYIKHLTTYGTDADLFEYMSTIFPSFSPAMAIAAGPRSRLEHSMARSAGAA